MPLLVRRTQIWNRWRNSDTNFKWKYPAVLCVFSRCGSRTWCDWQAHMCMVRAIRLCGGHVCSTWLLFHCFCLRWSRFRVYILIVFIIVSSLTTVYFNYTLWMGWNVLFFLNCILVSSHQLNFRSRSWFCFWFILYKTVNLFLNFSYFKSYWNVKEQILCFYSSIILTTLYLTFKYTILREYF